MSATVESVVTDALGLPSPLRAFVAEKLIESLDAPDTPPLSLKWQEEIRRRCSEVDRGAVELHHADKVFDKAFAALGIAAREVMEKAIARSSIDSAAFELMLKKNQETNNRRKHFSFEAPS